MGGKMGKFFFTYPTEYANSRFINKASAQSRRQYLEVSSVEALFGKILASNTYVITVAKEKLQRMAIRVNE